MDIKTGKTTGKINNGNKFFWIFLILTIPRLKIGITIIAKKWILISPNNKTKNVVIDIEPNNNTMLVLLTSIFNRYTSPPWTGIRPINGIAGTNDVFVVSIKLKSLLGVL